MSLSTIYDVKVRYSVDNRAGEAVDGLAKKTKALGHEAKSAGEDFLAMGKWVVGAFAGHEAKKALIDFNSNVENAKIGLSAMIQGNRGGSWEHATDQAGKLYQEFQNFSQLTPVTTQEILEFGKSVAVSTFQAGGAIKDLTTVTEQGVIAAKAFGYGSAYASLELSEMLAGNVNKRMMFAKQLLGMAHVDEKEFNSMTAEKRLGLVESVLTSDSMKNAAQAFGNSFSGITSTFEDKMQIVLGKVGLPLFEAIKNEIKGWSEWLEVNKHKIEDIGHTMGTGLATGFGVVREAVTLLVSHAGTLIALGKIWLAVKIGGLAANVMKGGGVAGGVIGSLFGGGRTANAAGEGAHAAGFFRAGREAVGKQGDEGYVPAIKGGAGRENVTGKNIAGAIPLLAQSAAVGYALGSIISEATGLKDALHELAIGDTGRKFEMLNRASDSLADSLQRAADANPKQSRAETNLTGSIQNYTTLANLAGDAARAAMESADGGDTASYVWQQKMDALEKLGVGQEDIDKAGGIQAFAQSQADRANQLQAQKESLTQQGGDAFELGIMTLTEYQRQTLDAAKAQQDLLAYINMQLSKGIPVLPEAITAILRRDTDDPEGKHKKLAEKPNVSVHINRIEVQSDDPDRMAFGLIESFRDAAKNPSSALSALREG